MTDWDGCRWDGRSGHYESWFQRANHPTRPLSLWIRHTIFCPKGNPGAAEGEIWSVWSDGEKGTTFAQKTELPRRDCSFDSSSLDVKMPGGSVKPGHVHGGTGKLKWDLRWSGGLPVSLLMPEAVYTAGFPKAKALSVVPNAKFEGTYEVSGETHRIDGWPGSHNHNWGSQHTDRYAWGQVCGFDDAPDAFLECGTAQVKVGPLMTPKVTVAVLSLEGRRYELNSIPRGAFVKASVDGFAWKFTSRAGGVTLDVAVEAEPKRFAALRYRNPPGGVKACLNSKIARCTVRLTENEKTRTLTSAHRAAFEILCEDTDPRIAQVGGFQV